ncbi:hypothetical protein ACP4OV_021414 [Aristida adscensionis]
MGSKIDKKDGLCRMAQGNVSAKCNSVAVVILDDSKDESKCHDKTSLNKFGKQVWL